MTFLFKSRLGLGTNRIGTNPKKDLASLHYALDIGYSVFDTAERYMDQASETIIGQCLDQRTNFDRSSIQIVTKVQPHNSVIDSCMGSLKRLKCDYIDFFLLHWRGDSDLVSVVKDMIVLQEQGYIKHYGVSNFTVDDLIEWRNIECKLVGTPKLAVNQIKYNFIDRAAEESVMPFHNKHNICTMAYMPLGKGAVLSDPGLCKYADEHSLTPGQVALKWVLEAPGTIAIPKSSDLGRMKENLDVLLTLHQ